MKKNIILIFTAFIVANLFAQESNLIPAIRPIIDDFLFKERLEGMITKVKMSTSNFSEDKTEDDVSSFSGIQWVNHEVAEDIYLEGCLGLTAALIGLDTSIDTDYELGGYASIKYRELAIKSGGTYLKRSISSSRNIFSMLSYGDYSIKVEVDPSEDTTISILASNGFLEQILHLLMFADYSTQSNTFSGGLYNLRFNVFKQLVFIEAPIYYDDGLNFRPGILLGTPDVMSLALYFFINEEYMGGSFNFLLDLKSASSMWLTYEEVNRNTGNMIMEFSVSYNDSFNNKSFNTKIYDKVITSISMSILY